MLSLLAAIPSPDDPRWNADYQRARDAAIRLEALLSERQPDDVHAQGWELFATLLEQPVSEVKRRLRVVVGAVVLSIPLPRQTGKDSGAIEDHYNAIKGLWRAVDALNRDVYNDTHRSAARYHRGLLHRHSTVSQWRILKVLHQKPAILTAIIADLDPDLLIAEMKYPGGYVLAMLTAMLYRRV